MLYWNYNCVVNVDFLFLIIKEIIVTRNNEDINEYLLIEKLNRDWIYFKMSKCKIKSHFMYKFDNSFVINNNNNDKDNDKRFIL